MTFMDSLAHAWRDVSAENDIETSALFKATKADFRVDEVLNWAPSGAGEHVCVRVCKQGLSTVDVARRLARAAGIRLSDVGYSGLKDRVGICTQWFSLHMAGKPEPDLAAMSDDACQVESVQRNHRKIRRGTHKANQFRIVLREVRDPQNLLASRLEQLAVQGVPNYFGEQRFGWQDNNLRLASDWFDTKYRPRSRSERSMLLSAARSRIFNAVLSRRVSEGSWNTLIPGDVMNLAGSDSIFDASDATGLSERLSAGDIHPTGPLWGKGELRTVDAARALEQSVAGQYSQSTAALEKHGLTQARRSLRLMPDHLHYARPSADVLELQFTLPPGTYATVILRELCQYRTGQTSENATS